MKQIREKAKMISIWTWVGLVLCTYGILILSTGIYYLNSPHHTVLGEMHPRIWWGGVMLIVGILFLAILGRRDTSTLS